ncbi:UDP-N-acetylmuramyl pentapeptide phosphotransferase/UDP-N-acetylglucosamine-1-phosphate transferase [Candidatus Nitrospira nitrificans]|uniref:UDP-N-acetylmuramyl pentapeptide phosphotransferase/UDP-N-acetylglucosamine-1-phosphate transferase n=2 Tax=Candidatus Nitrospira nitrificans TaxID=1742973 RepID=A0A0S4LLZ6_9BACT|nr:UDP-N-acetylmuramyl pentapeptide phosphotransferase/UDP-N-acetylglucosamine-1-phosphate transferase [Candidatus Nitrospira nitrificans]
MVAFPAVIAFVVAWWLTGRLCSPGSYLSILALPNDRTLHSRPTPQTGGVAIIASVVISLIAAASVFAITQPSKVLLPKGVASGSLWIVLAMLLVFVVSFIDDCIGLRASLRLGVQAVAAIIIVGGVGLALSSVPLPGGSLIPMGFAAVPVSALFLIWMANLYNFMDGMDGFSGGMTAIGFGFLAYFGWEAGSPVMLMIAVFVSMSALGFLVHNFPPARIFMGDAGSITLGFLAGTLMLLGVRDGIFEFWVPIILFSSFILDATVTVLRRAFRGERIWEAHRQHYYQRLVLNGWSHRRTVLAEYGVMLLCGGLSVLYHHSTDNGKLAILGAWLAVFLVLGSLVKWLERRQAVSHSVRSAKTESDVHVQAESAEGSQRVTVKT